MRKATLTGALTEPRAQTKSELPRPGFEAAQGRHRTVPTTRLAE